MIQDAPYYVADKFVREILSHAIEVENGDRLKVEVKPNCVIISPKTEIDMQVNLTALKEIIEEGFLNPEDAADNPLVFGSIYYDGYFFLLYIYFRPQ